MGVVDFPVARNLHTVCLAQLEVVHEDKACDDFALAATDDAGLVVWVVELDGVGHAIYRLGVGVSPPIVITARICGTTAIATATSRPCQLVVGRADVLAVDKESWSGRCFAWHTAWTLVHEEAIVAVGGIVVHHGESQVGFSKRGHVHHRVALCGTFELTCVGPHGAAASNEA